MGKLLDFYDDQMDRGSQKIQKKHATVDVIGKPKYDAMISSILDGATSIQNIDRIVNVLIHDKNCPSCKESVPIFLKIGSIVNGIIPTYKYYPIELSQQVSDETGGKVTGLEIVKHFNAKGVPFVIQNGTIERVDNIVTFVERPFFIQYIGKIDPIRYVSTVFNVDNPRFNK